MAQSLTIGFLVTGSWSSARNLAIGNSSASLDSIADIKLWLALTQQQLLSRAIRTFVLKKSPAEAERRCRSWCRASWPAQGPSCIPADPCGAARASRPREIRASAAGSTAGQPGRSSQRLRPCYTVSPAGQRLKRSRPAVGAAQAVHHF